MNKEKILISYEDINRKKDELWQLIEKEASHAEINQFLIDNFRVVFDVNFLIGQQVKVISDIAEGEIIKESDLYAKRPGTGFAPNQIDQVIGKKVIKSIPADTIILPENIN